VLICSSATLLAGAFDTLREDVSQHRIVSIFVDVVYSHVSTI
jgi:hypothetical protein